MGITQVEDEGKSSIHAKQLFCICYTRNIDSQTNFNSTCWPYDSIKWPDLGLPPICFDSGDNRRDLPYPIVCNAAAITSDY